MSTRSGVTNVRRGGGFTLVELLIAMALTVLIGALSYQFVSAAADVGERGEVAIEHMTELERFWAILAADLQHVVARPIPVPATGNDRLAGFLSDPAFLPPADSDSGPDEAPRRPALLASGNGERWLSELTGSDGAVLWLTRGNWVNPLQHSRPELQRVQYRWQDNAIWRDSWEEHNQDMDTPPQNSQRVLSGVTELQLRFLPVGQAPVSGWAERWPFASAHPLPAAVDIQLRGATMGDIRRLMLLPGGA